MSATTSKKLGAGNCTEPRTRSEQYNSIMKTLPSTVVLTIPPAGGGSSRAGVEVAQALADRGVEVHLVSSDRPDLLDAPTPERIEPWWTSTPLNAAIAPPGPLTPPSLHVEPSVSLDTPDATVFRAARVPSHTEVVDAGGITWHYPTPPPVRTGADAMLGFVRLQRCLSEVIADVDPQLINVHRILPVLLALDASDLSRTVASTHGTDIVYLPDDLRAEAAHRLLRCRAITAPSRHLAHVVASQVGAVAVEVVSNPVPENLQSLPRRARLARREHLGCSAEVVLVHLSSFQPVKQAPDCIDALAAVREHHDAELWLLGDGPDLDEVMDRAVLLGVADAVRCFGYRRDALDLLATSDVMLLPSRTTGQGRVVLEALACGVGVVSYPAPPVVELLGTAGGVVAANWDVASFAEAARAAAEPTKIAGFRRRAPRRVAHLTRDAVDARWVEILSGATQPVRR
jgi:glycosyltransferase involved in cell wall biosynthesis